MWARGGLNTFNICSLTEDRLRGCKGHPSQICRDYWMIITERITRYASRPLTLSQRTKVYPQPALHPHDQAGVTPGACSVPPARPVFLLRWLDNCRPGLPPRRGRVWDVGGGLETSLPTVRVRPDNNGSVVETVGVSITRHGIIRRSPETSTQSLTFPQKVMQNTFNIM